MYWTGFITTILYLRILKFGIRQVEVSQENWWDDGPYIPLYFKETQLLTNYSYDLRLEEL